MKQLDKSKAHLYVLANAWDTIGIIYILIPVLFFFVLYTQIYIAIPATLIFTYSIITACKKTDWRMKIGLRHVLVMLIAGAWIFFLDGGSSFSQKSDWHKHYAILNALASNASPFSLPEFQITDIATGSLRYPIAFYIIPTLLHVSTGMSLKLSTSLYIFAGVFIFFNIAERLYTTPKMFFLAIAVFVFFSGADILGMLATKTQLTDPGLPEWWAMLMQYSSNTTVLLWVPQYGLPAWILSAIFIKQHRTHDHILDIGAPLLLATILWSPFITAGLTPFAAYIWISKSKPKFNFLFFSSLICIACPLCIYVLSNTYEIPKDIFYFPFRIYLLFIIIEFSAYSIFLILFSSKLDRTLIYIATAFLLLIPLVKIGANNDFVMRVSIPALAMTSLLLPCIMHKMNTLWKTALLLVFLTGSATPLIEIGWSARTPYESSMQQSTFDDFKSMYPPGDVKKYVSQYIAPIPEFLFRKSS
jgi:hypothetical protein